VTREEAEARAAKLNREAADGGTHHHVVRRAGDAWGVVKIRVPADFRRGEVVETVEAAEKPPYPDDPRDLHTQHRPGY
jgi:hypothetical protein